MRKFKIKVNGQEYEVEVEEIKDNTYSDPTIQKTNSTPVQTKKTAQSVKPAPTVEREQQPAARPPKAGGNAAGGIKAPMPGVINSINVKAGDAVKVGDVLCILEAMKLENEIQAEKGGIVKEIYVSQGQNVNAGDILMVIE